jgi:uncharacterized protein (DUF2235 family)
MKKLVVCADGTWNTDDDTDHGFPCPTNVTKIARALLPADKDGVPQVVRHIDGVGSQVGIKVRGGAVADFFITSSLAIAFSVKTTRRAISFSFSGFPAALTPRGAWRD